MGGKSRGFAIGTKYGSYTIISDEFNEDNKIKVWIQCYCGIKRKAERRTLPSLKTCKLCSSYTRISKRFNIGDRYGNLELIGFNPHEPKERVFKVKCDCGNIYDKAVWRKSFHCSQCKPNSKGSDHKLYRNTEFVSKAYFLNCLKGAIKRNIQFEISIDYINELLIKQNHKCALSGLLIVENSRDRSKNKDKNLHTASLDRIDSNYGYLEGNVQWVHKNINLMKWKLSQNEFIQYCQLIAKKNPESIL